MSTRAHHRQASPFGAGLRSVLLPGWGQVVSRGATVGWILIGIATGLVVVAIALVGLLGPTEVVARLADPAVLTGILVANALIGLARLASTAHAWWSAGGRNALVVLVLAIVVIAPHAAVGWVGGEARDALVDLFEPPTPPVAVSTTTTTTTTTQPPAESSTTTIQPTTTTTTTTTTQPPAVFTDRLNILLLGGDAGPGRPGLRTDTIMVASVDPTTGDAALFGIPRNFGGITFSDGSRFDGQILNEVYGWGVQHPDRFGGIDPGASAVVDVVEHMTGLEVDYFVLVDLTGFGDLIDAVGGVTVEIPQRIEAPLYNTRTGGYTMTILQPGTHRLDGDHALAYARSRTGSDDYHRMGRQRCLLAAMVDQARPVTVFARLPLILGAIRDNVTTDLPIDLVPELLRLLPLVDAGEIRVVGFDRSWRSGWSDLAAVPDIDRIREAVATTLTDPDGAGSVGVGTVAEDC